MTYNVFDGTLNPVQLICALPTERMGALGNRELSNSCHRWHRV